MLVLLVSLTGIALPAPSFSVDTDSFDVTLVTNRGRHPGENLGRAAYAPLLLLLAASHRQRILPHHLPAGASRHSEPLQ